MKKFCFVICCILMIPMLLVGCKEEDNSNDFVLVQSITYSVGGETTICNSYWKLHTKGESLATTYTEYTENINTYSSWHSDYSSNSKYNMLLFVDYEKINPTNSNIPNFTSGDYVYYSTSTSININELDKYCRKIMVDYIDVYYVKVRIIKDNLIELKSKTGQISQILCDSYQINYFI